MSKPNLLVVDDDESIRGYLGKFLSLRGYDVECANSGERAIVRLRAANLPSLLLLDLMMPKIGGLDVLNEMNRLGRHVPTIVLSGSGQVQTVVKAVRLGAFDFLVKPFDDEDLERAIENALDDGQPEHPDGAAEFSSKNATVLRIRDIAVEVADTDVPVLILGESGVGKEVLARHIHASSSRREEPFVRLNCAALPADLLESELFGYERGAFTGAMREKPGKFELAGKGTILLDEIGEMSPTLQAKLLHVLQDGEYTRLGGSQPARAQARVLAATNQHLGQAVAKGTFREDLYFRLNVIRLELPPLRERTEDILPLCNLFLETYRAKYRRPARPLPAEMVTALQRYSWPGNIRQLENVIKRYVILPHAELDLFDLRPAPVPAPLEPKESASPTSAESRPAEKPSLKKVSALAAERAEKEVVMRTLEELNWNRKQTARRLSISYKALLNKLKRWNAGNQSKSAEAG